MKKCLFFLALVFSFLACTHVDKEIRQTISGSDSIAVNYFKGDGTMDTVVSVKIIRDKQQMNELVELISASSNEANFQCGQDGSLHFFKFNKVIQRIDFSMHQPGCMQFLFSKDGKYTATKLSSDAKQLLIAIRK